MRALVTGGAGFIGSSVVARLLADGHDVAVLDDLSTGYADNVPVGVALMRAGVADADAVAEAVAGRDVVFHLAASRAVLRSVEAPLETDTANTHGTLTVLDAAHRAGVRRVVYASSSSVYGGAEQRPTPEDHPTVPRSPYAVSKLAGEHYCRVFAELFDLETVALRFFNVFGPRQRPDSAYAAVIPLFIDALHRGQAPVVHGDGGQSRDFTFVDDVTEALLAAAEAPAERCTGQAFNVAAGEEHSLLDLLGALGRILAVEVAPVHEPPRAGDIRHSRAAVAAVADALGWRAEVAFHEGLRRTVAWTTADR